MTFDLGDLIAGLALLLAGWSTHRAVQFNRRQNEFDETAERLNNILIEREAREAVKSQRADVSADFVGIGSSRCKFRVYNKGKADARNVRLEVLDGEELLLGSDIKNRFPISKLEPHAKVSIIAVPTMDSSTSVNVRLVWDDDSGDGQSVELMRHVY